MVIGRKDYQLQLSRLAYEFGGGIGIEYLESVGYERFVELIDHSRVISAELDKSG